MTDPNLFQEIDDALERQKIEQFWKSYGSLFLAIALTIIVGTAGYNFWQNHRTEHNQAAVAGLLNVTAVPNTDAGKQIDALTGFAGKFDGDAAGALAQIRAGGLAAKAGNAERAVTIYNSVADNKNYVPELRQLAALYAVRAQFDTAPAEELDKKLETLQADGAPWKFTAMEYRAYLALHAGDKTKAKDLLSQLSQNAEVPPTLAARATDTLRVLSE
jgi:hypothetical protein